jgi:hypothetical protein
MTTLSAFLATLTPMRAAKAKSALEMMVRNNGQSRLIARQELVERCMKEGYQVTLRKNGERVLMSPDGSFYDTRNITATGLDYATFISESDHAN